MAKIVWTKSADIKAYTAGLKCASKCYPRVRETPYDTYNERAAFNDGWDTYKEMQLATRKGLRIASTDQKSSRQVLVTQRNTDFTKII